jgi:hypothetical protein
MSDYRDVDVLSPSPNPEESLPLPIEEPKKKSLLPPKMHILSMDGKIQSDCVVPLSEYGKLQARDLQMGKCLLSASSRHILTKKASLLSESLTDTCFYILSPLDILLARLRTLDDRIDWLVSKDKVLEALEAAESDPSTSIIHTERVHRVGQQAIQWAIDLKNYTLAADLCHRVFNSQADLWEPWIPVFCALGHVDLLVPHIPVTESNLLPLDVYDTILSYIMDSPSKKGLVEALTLWPRSLYDGEKLMGSLEERLLKGRKEKKESLDIVKESILLLYESAKYHSKAVKLGLELRKPGILSLISEHSLYADLEKLAVEVLEYDADVGGLTDEFGNQEGAALLVNNGGRIPVSTFFSRFSTITNLYFRNRWIGWLVI